jgi:MarR family 2-MHQ and catechol resistance regulon transcriptional repressor
MSTHHHGSGAEVTALNVFINLFRAADTIHLLIQRHIKAAGLTEPQFGMLETLMHLGPLEQHVLAEKLLVSRGNITFIVDKLEEAGLIERETRKGDDRRCTRVSLTPIGRSLISTIFPVQAAYITELIGVLTSEEQIELARLLKKLGTNNKSKI